MIVCHCNVFSDHDVRACLGPDGPRTPAQVYACLGCSPQCGRCARTIRTVLDRALSPAACAAACGAACPHAPAADADARLAAAFG
ncbi:MAG TPA: (2Fe-2S)-binding protein [Microvirga sp.]|jgi:bacterioferritin-associated ferredoxin|nr:(2Fe-2S)-binding protein [Microvirga sp.]